MWGEKLPMPALDSDVCPTSGPSKQSRHLEKQQCCEDKREAHCELSLGWSSNEYLSRRLARGGGSRSGTNASMLRYANEDAFEQWLRSCPLDEHALNYAVSRGNDGLLTVQCTWRVAPLTRHPLHSNEHQPEALNADSSASCRGSAETDGNTAAAAGGSGMSGSAMMAAMMEAMSRVSEKPTAGQDRSQPSAEDIRSMMAASGMRFPKAPGASFASRSAAKNEQTDVDHSATL